MQRGSNRGTMNRIQGSWNRTAPVVVASVALVAGVVFAASGGSIAAEYAPVSEAGAAGTNAVQGGDPFLNAAPVVGPVHADVLAPFNDDGVLTLDSQADMDANGDGKSDLGERFDPTTAVFELLDSDASRKTLPAGYEFIAPAGTQVWMIPQVWEDTNHETIWAGFNSLGNGFDAPEAPNSNTPNGLEITLDEAEGPGDLVMFLGGSFGSEPQRLFSTKEQLDPWRIDRPQHTHMNWVFTAQGTYTLTFTVRGEVSGREQHSTKSFTFVVGAPSEPVGAVTKLEAAPDRVDVTEGVNLRASVTPADAEGIVAFYDGADQLGVAEIWDGVARFPASNLEPGTHRISAQYQPPRRGWYEDPVAKETSVTVAGDVDPVPANPDAWDPEYAALDEGNRGDVLLRDSTLLGGDRLGINLGTELRGARASLWIVGRDDVARRLERSASKDWFAVSPAGTPMGVVAVPEDLASGEYKVAVRVFDDATGDTALAGWTGLTIAEGASRPGGGESGDGGDGGGTSGGSAGPAPSAGGQQRQETVDGGTMVCTDPLVLTEGHMDGFYVSAAEGQAILQFMEDVTGYHVTHDPETVLQKIGSNAFSPSIQGGPAQGRSGYVIPETQQADVIWTGWDTNSVANSGYTDVRINVTGVDGPGTVYLYHHGQFGQGERNGTNTALESGAEGGWALPGVIRERTPAHTHAEWVFTEPGIYILTAHAALTNPGNGDTIQTGEHRYVFQVGDVDLGDTFCTVQPNDANSNADSIAEMIRRANQAKLEEQSAAAAAAQPQGVANAEAQPQPQVVQQQVLAETGISPFLSAGIGAGGSLLLVAIGATTYWYVRRLRGAQGASDGAAGDGAAGDGGKE